MAMVTFLRHKMLQILMKMMKTDSLTIITFERHTLQWYILLLETPCPSVHFLPHLMQTHTNLICECVRQISGIFLEDEEEGEDEEEDEDEEEEKEEEEEDSKELATRSLI